MSLRALGTIFLLTLALAIISAAQTIDSISPASGGIGTQITITGTSLYSSRDMNQLFIGGVETIPISWTNTQIVAVIPSGIPGNSTSISIYTQYSNRYDDWASNTVLWTVQQPPITSITPTEGYPGDTVILRGSGFGATQGSSFVTLDSVAAPVTFWNDTRFTSRFLSARAAQALYLTALGSLHLLQPLFVSFLLFSRSIRRAEALAPNCKYTVKTSHRSTTSTSSTSMEVRPKHPTGLAISSL
jgi:hypothetical protein